MAKKEEFSYLNMPSPSTVKHSSSMRNSFGGLDLRGNADVGALSIAENISFEKYPAIGASKPLQCIELWRKLPNFNEKGRYTDENVHIVSFLGVDDFLAVVYLIENDVQDLDGLYIDFLKPEVEYGEVKRFKIITSRLGDKDNFDGVQRTLLKFNVFTSNIEIVGGEYKKKLLLLPDCVSFDYDFENAANEYDEITKNDLLLTNIKEFEGDTADSIPETASKGYFYVSKTNKMAYAYDEMQEKWVETSIPAFPKLDYACVHLSRLFGVDKFKVYASGYNDYANWALDTVSSYAESNAWVSSAQSNTKADSDFSGIVNYNGHVVCFKKKFMHEIYNNTNPFRVVDIYADGCIDNRSIQEVNGKLFFASDDGIKVYTGGVPASVSEPLAIRDIKYAVSGTDGRKYYVYTKNNQKDGMFVFDTDVGLWSEITSPLFTGEPIVGFVNLGKDVYCMDGAGYIFKLFVSGAKNTHDIYCKTEGIKKDGKYEMNDSKTKEYPRTVRFRTELVTSGSLDTKHIRKLSVLYKSVDRNEPSAIVVKVFVDGNEFEAEDRSVNGYGYGEYGIVRFKPRFKGHNLFGVEISDFYNEEVQSFEVELESGGDAFRDN